MRARSLSQMITRVIAHARATPNRIESSDSTALEDTGKCWMPLNMPI